MLGVALAIGAISFTLWMGSSTGDVTASTSPPVDEAAIKTCLDEMGATVVTDEFGNVGSDKSSSAVDECLALGHDTSANTLTPLQSLSNSQSPRKLRPSTPTPTRFTRVWK